MKVILSGRVTMAHIEDAELMAGIVPTSFVVNDLQRAPPAELKLPVNVLPICKMQAEDSAIRQRNYSLAHEGEALICIGRNEHLVAICEKYGLPVYQDAASREPIDLFA